MTFYKFFLTIISIVNLSTVFSERGRITFYDNQPNACQYDLSMYTDYLRVAISNDLWDNGAKCGTCLTITGLGTGIGTTPFLGTHDAIVTNLCPECEHGHYDLMTAGDGIWDITYEIVPCKKLGDVQYKTDSTNPYYFKIQIINTGSEITSLTLEGQPCTKTHDNYWVFYDPTQLGGSTFSYPLPITITMADGSSKSGMVSNTPNYTNL